MEDPESKHTLVSEEEPHQLPLKICSVPFRLKRPTLAMREMIKVAAIITSLQVILSIGVLFMRPALQFYMRWYSIWASIPIAVLYVTMYINLASGGWGSASSRFWCDVKIMYARGFNTMRTISRIFSVSIFLIYLSVLLGQRAPLALWLMLLVGALIEWQVGTGENVNQYDVKAYDKFMNEDGILCLESLNYYQTQKDAQRVKWTPFAITVLTRFYATTCILCTGTYTNIELVFQIPLATCIVFYIAIVPTMFEFVYYKGVLTFCQLELYRSVMDIAFCLIIHAFSLV